MSRTRNQKIAVARSILLANVPDPLATVLAVIVTEPHPVALHMLVHEALTAPAIGAAFHRAAAQMADIRNGELVL